MVYIKPSQHLENMENHKFGNMKKQRFTIPQLNKVWAILQQEIDSKYPFCSSTDVGDFEIHHIDENPDNHKIENLIFTLPEVSF